MNTDPNKPNFLDRSTILALVIVFAFWFGWSKYMNAKYPAQTAAATATGTDQPAQPNAVGAAAGQGEAKANAATAAAPGAAPAAKEEFIDFGDDTWEFQVSTFGMGLSGIHLKKYQTRENGPVRFAETAGESAFATRLPPYNEPLVFKVERTAPDTFVGKADVGPEHIEKTLKVNSATYTVETSIKVTGGFKGLATRMADVIPPKADGGFLSRSQEFLSWYILHTDDKKTRKPIDASKGLDIHEQNASLVSLTAHYFALAVLDKSPLQPKFDTNLPIGAPNAVGQLVYEPTSPLDSVDINYTSFAGPKSYELMNGIDEKLTSVIDYGTFWIIGKPILWLLKYIQTIIGNWGIAIIILTIIVRMLVMPFTIYSYKSMKIMQKLQPEMARIRAKYEDKPADQKVQMNAEIMDLMKRNKANPVGGCLPMLLQLPVFIALYAVLGQSIELYRQPFMLWIHDLSMKDPFFVLPVLMGITMFVQQKMTPSTMDPQQAKIMMWMPVLFSFFMISLPSGLTLYIFVSTLMGIIQQKVFMRDRTPTPTVKEAKA